MSCQTSLWSSRHPLHHRVGIRGCLEKSEHWKPPGESKVMEWSISESMPSRYRTDGVETNSINSRYLLIIFALHLASFPITGTGDYRLQLGETLNVTQKITSSGGNFALGFFSLGNSTKHYLGIWYDKIKVDSVIWVANGENPLTDSNGLLTLSQDGNLKLQDGRKRILWTTNVSVSDGGGNYSTNAALLDSGNLELRRTTATADDHGVLLWQSFDHPIGSFLPGMRLWLNTTSGQSIKIVSWKEADDPSPGLFSVGIDPEAPRQLVMWKGHQRYWRGYIWQRVSSVELYKLLPSQIGYMSVFVSEDESSLQFSTSDSSVSIKYLLSHTGRILQQRWDARSGRWDETSLVQKNDSCSIYGSCGPYGSCDGSSDTTRCRCLEGFRPRWEDEWEKGNWSGGCVRRRVLNCGEGTDRLLTLQRMKLPDRSLPLGNISAEACASECLRNCSCTAYAYNNDSEWGIWKCLVWMGELIDLVENYDDTLDLNIRLAHSEPGGNGNKSYIAIFLPAVGGIVIICAIGYFLWRRHHKMRNDRTSEDKFFEARNSTDYMDEANNPPVPMFTFNCINSATNNFSERNNLGKGGFGVVYKGVLEHGLEIAVKRLSNGSTQGLLEFKNEVNLIAKLNHKNLVRLLGWCMQGTEKILIYEFMPNKSLDKYLFDSCQKFILDWSRRFLIFQGVARGLNYLHHYSRLKVIHRDLKASNILLDDSMNPKISDFGLARIFSGNQMEENTSRVVGTYGYMSPEYAMDGIFSEKSDVYSIGVLVLEIVSGKKITAYNPTEDSVNLLGFAWKLWNEDRWIEFIDASIGESLVEREAKKCMHIGLLCVQDDPTDRPNMSFIISILENEAALLPPPRRPTFPFSRGRLVSHGNASTRSSANMVTVTMLEAR